MFQGFDYSFSYFFNFYRFYSSKFFGSYILKKTDLILGKIPLIKVFYKTIKQILETILQSNSNAFREAVLMEYPRKGVWVIGFTTGQVEGVIKIRQM